MIREFLTKIFQLSNKKSADEMQVQQLKINLIPHSI